MNEGKESLPTVDYGPVMGVAAEKAGELRPGLPLLPTDDDLAPYRTRMQAEDGELIKALTSHLEITGTAHGHSFAEHHEKVATISAYAAAAECDSRGITGADKDGIVKRTWRLGLLHDVERWRGWKPEHMIRGAEVADTRFLPQLGIKDDYITRGILLHDQMDVTPTGNPDFDIPFFSVFAADHHFWGLEWEKTRWQGLAKQQVPVETVIHDYSFIQHLVDSPNLQQTKWGREVALPIARFGLSIAQAVESSFAK